MTPGAASRHILVHVSRVAETAWEDWVSAGSDLLTFPVQTDQTCGAGSDRRTTSEASLVGRKTETLASFGS